MKYKRIAAGFVLVILLLSVLGGFSLVKLHSVADDVEKIYRHPFTVSNAAKNIRIHVISTARYMKDIVLAENEQQLDDAAQLVKFHEDAASREFGIIQERFLGNRSTIEEAYQAFLDWIEIRNTVIRLKREGKVKEAAAFTREEGDNQVKVLNTTTQALVDFANGKADQFYNNAQNNKEQVIFIISLLTFGAIGASIFISVYVVRYQLQSEKEGARKAHLIDQNIMLAGFAPDGTVTDASNALCRFLGVLKEEIIGRPGNFFINDNEQEEEQVEEIWRAVQTGKRWDGEIRRIDFKGNIHWASSQIFPVYNDRFEISGYSNILQDVTNKKQSITDNLTSLHNRRRYEEIIQKELRLAKRQESALTLAIIDIDFFKRYNDRYGHPKGDTALAKVGHALLESLKRPNDYAFRIGGEEFAILFSGLDRDASRAFLEEIRARVEALAIPHEKSDVAEILTVSIGASTISGVSAPDKEELYIMADKALYLAKNTRNSVILD